MLTNQQQITIKHFLVGQKKALKDCQEKNLFEKCYILKNTFSIKLLDIDHRNKLSFDFCHLIQKSSFDEKSKKNITVKDFMGNNYKYDQSRGLLIFLSDLLILLSLKETYKGSLLKKYFPTDFELQTGDEVDLDN